MIRPGDLLSYVIRQVTGREPCAACNSCKAEMNENGWWWCWKNRKRIAAHLAKEANKMGFPASEKSMLRLLVIAFKVFRESRKEGKDITEGWVIQKNYVTHTDTQTEELVSICIAKSREFKPSIETPMSKNYHINSAESFEDVWARQDEATLVNTVTGFRTGNLGQGSLATKKK